MKVNLNELESRVKTGSIKKYVSGEYIGWCYTQKCQYERRWDNYTRIARGIVTLSDGTLIARPFTKFFNLGEPEAGEIPWHEPIEVTEKLDGSLIVVSFHDGQPIINTKGGFHNEYTEFARNWLITNFNEWLTRPDGHKDFTYCFEAIFPEINPENKKLINYGDRADLTLLARIERESGAEGSYENLLDIGDEWGMSVAPRHDFNDIDALISRCRSRKIEEGEGVVLRFTDTNMRVKVKSEEFLRLNRLISHTSEKHILESLAKGDDIESIYAALPDELFAEVQQIVEQLRVEFYTIQDRVSNALIEIQKIPIRKAQSKYIYENPELSDIKGLIFAKLDYKYTPRMVWDFMEKQRKRKQRESRDGL